jgi:low temperature requirement protein LtrA
MRVLMLSQYARAYRHVREARGGIRIYLLGTAGGAVLWGLSLAVPAPGRYWLWGAGVLVDAVAPLLVTVSRTQVPLHPEHLPERFALLVILVLGESVASLAHGVHGAHWTRGSVAVAVVCFVLAAALWWSYFDLAGAAAKHLLNEAGGADNGPAHDVYVYGQLPLCLALAAVGSAIQTVVLAGSSPASHGARVVLAGGVALYLVSVGLTNAGMSEGFGLRWWWTLVPAGVALADAFLDLPTLAVTGVLAALLVVVVVVGLEQVARGPVDLQKL